MIVTADELELAQLRVEVERLRKENVRLLRNAGRRAAFIAKVDRAHGDAVLFLSLRAGGIQPSLRYCKEELHIGRRRWQWANALLKLSRLFGRAQVDPALAKVKLDGARDDVFDNPILLRKKLPAHGRDEWTRRVRQSGWSDAARAVR